MTDSLLLDGLYELIGGATNPEYRLMPSSDALGQPAPDTALIAGTLLDGDRVTGLRSANRNVVLPIMVTGTSRSDIAVKVNRLLQVVDAQSKSSFTLTWTPDGGLPVIFDCYRGGYTRERIITREQQLVTVVTLAFQANPFGRSNVIRSISAVSPQLPIDSMGTPLADTFNRANSATTINPASDGGTWTVDPSGVYGITGNKAYLVSGANATARIRRDTGQVAADVSFVDARANTNGISYIWLAYNPANDTGYQISYDGSNLGYAVYRWASGVATHLGDVNAVGAAWTGSTATIRATYQPSTGVVQVFQNGVSEGTVTDGTPITGASNTWVGLSATQNNASTGETWDDFSALAGAPTGATLDTTIKNEGVASAAVTLTRSNPSPGQYQYDSGNVSRSITTVDLSTYSSVGFRVYWPAPATTGNKPWTGVASLWLYDTHGTFGHLENIPNVKFTPSATNWQLIMVSLAAFTTFPALDLTAINKWQIKFSTLQANASTTPPATSTLHIDDLRAYPAASTAISTPEGAVVTIPAVAGSARSPLAISADRGGSALADLLVHHPPIWQDLDAQILAQLVSNTVTIAAANNTFRGTYTLWLLLGTLGSGTRTVTVTLTHKQGATTLATATLVRTYSATPGHGIAIGEVTLPLKDVPAENVADTLVIAVSSTGGTADTFTDVALCDTSGETVWIGSPPASSLGVYVDEPDPATECPAVYASTTTDRTAAVSVLGDANTRFGGGGLFVVPGDNRLLTASSSGTPNLVASYYDRWLDERG